MFVFFFKFQPLMLESIWDHSRVVDESISVSVSWVLLAVAASNLCVTGVHAIFLLMTVGAPRQEK